MSHLFFDTETTGLPNFKASSTDAAQPKICQIGAILVCPERKVKAELNLIIKPEGWTIPEEVSKIHGITQADAEKYGVSMKEAMSMFWELVKSAKFMVAHNISFDFFMLRIAAHLCGLSEPKEFSIEKHCTMNMAKEIMQLPPTEKMMESGLRGYKSPNLQEAYKHFHGVEFEGAHDAMADVRACRDVYYKINQNQRVAA